MMMARRGKLEDDLQRKEPGLCESLTIVPKEEHLGYFIALGDGAADRNR
jgi:hypothetical protein